MRWEALFAELEAEADEQEAQERRFEVADRIRAEVGRLRLIDRLKPSVGAPKLLRIGLLGHPPLTGRLTGLGVDWLLVEQAGATETVIPLAAVQLIQGLGAGSAEPGWEGLIGERLNLRIALRRLVRDRITVTVGLSSADVLAGRLARVGADHFEVAATDPSGRSTGAGWTVPLTALSFVRRQASG